MQAIIMAAGKGVRMLPLTKTTPKPLLKVNGKPILEHTILQLPDEVDEIIVGISYLKEQIREFLRSKFPDKKITYIESEIKGTGYAVGLCKGIVTGKFLVLNGDDLYKKSDLEKLLSYSNAILCKNVDATSEYSRFGKIITSPDHDFLDISMSDSPWVNTGAYILTEQYFDYPLVQMKSGEFGLPQTILSMAQAGVKVKIVEADFWVPIGYPEDIEKAERILNEQ